MTRILFFYGLTEVVLRFWDQLLTRLEKKKYIMAEGIILCCMGRNDRTQRAHGLKMGILNKRALRSQYGTAVKKQVKKFHSSRSLRAA